MRKTILILLLVLTWVCGESFQAQAVPIIDSAGFGQKRAQSYLFQPWRHAAKPIKGKKSASTQPSTCAASQRILILSPRTHHGPGLDLHPARRFGKLSQHHAGSPPVHCPDSGGTASDGNGETQLDNASISPGNTEWIDDSNGDTLLDLTLTSPLVPEIVIDETWPDSNLLSNDLTVNGPVTNDIRVPEPTTLELLSGGLAALVLIGYLRRAAKGIVGTSGSSDVRPRQARLLRAPICRNRTVTYCVYASQIEDTRAVH